jgi:hypothetical protein
MLSTSLKQQHTPQSPQLKEEIRPISASEKLGMKLELIKATNEQPGSCFVIFHKNDKGNY